MPPVVVAQLVAQFGLPLAQQIFFWIKEGKTTVTPEDFEVLATLAKYRSADSLSAAGIKIEDGKVVPA